MNRTFGLIPAAGKSQRMGHVKLALPLGDRTILEVVVAALKQAGVDAVLVVIGPEANGLKVLAEKAGALVLQLAHETDDMRQTVEHGLSWLEANMLPPPGDKEGWLLLPADHPCLDPGSIRQVLVAKDMNPQASIVVPVFAGQRGHPTWIAWRHVAAIKSLEKGLGLNTYLRQHANETLELAALDRGVVEDLDTPEDYRRLLGGTL